MKSNQQVINYFIAIIFFALINIQTLIAQEFDCAIIELKNSDFDKSLKTSACEDWDLYGNDDCPIISSNTPIKTVRVSIHVIQKDDGTGNFDPYDSNNNIQGDWWWLRGAVQSISGGGANKILSELKEPNAVGSYGPYIQDSRIRFTVVGVYEWHNSVQWDVPRDSSTSAGGKWFSFIQSQQADDIGQVLNYKNNSIHLFIQGKPTLSVNGNYFGSGYAPLLGQKYTVLYNICGYETEYGPSRECGWPASTIAHEIAHVCGIAHSYTGNCGGATAEDDCDDTPSLPCTDPNNNLMGGTKRTALTRCQISTWHRNILTNRSNLQDVVEYSNSPTPIIEGPECIEAGTNAKFSLANYQLGDIVDWALTPPENFLESNGCANLADINLIKASQSEILFNIDQGTEGSIEAIKMFNIKVNCSNTCATAPTNLSVNETTLSWDPVHDAVSYQISSPDTNIDCACPSEATQINIEETSFTNSYLLQGGQIKTCFKWQVIAICSDGTESPASEQACYGTGIVSGCATAPANLQVNGTTLTWDAVHDAVSYQISSPDTNIDCACPSGVPQINIGATSFTNSWQIPGEQINTCFKWQVIAICSDGTESPASEQACYYAAATGNSCETAPTNLQVIGTTLSWDAVPDAITYTISSGGIITGCSCDNLITFPSTYVLGNSYNLPSAIQNSCFTWHVTANCNDGYNSGPSVSTCYDGYQGPSCNIQDYLFHLEDATGIPLTEFGPNQDVYLDGSLVPANTSYYNLTLYLRTSNDDIELGSTGSTGGHPGIINISQTFAGLPLFEPGNTFLIKQEFDVESCGILFQTAQFVWNDSGGCLISAPTNLSVIGSTLQWNPVDGAAMYVVNSPGITEYQIDCNCEIQYYLPSGTTTTNSLTLSKTQLNRCFVWRVKAVCSDGTESSFSNQNCYGGSGGSSFGGRVENSKSFKNVTVTPNPSESDIIFNTETFIDTDIIIEVYDLYGEIVKTFNRKLESNKLTAIRWNNTGLKTGLYIAKFTTNNDIVLKRIVVK